MHEQRVAEELDRGRQTGLSPDQTGRACEAPISEYWLEDWILRPSAVSEHAMDTTIHCASVGPHAIPVLTQVASDDRSTSDGPNRNPSRDTLVGRETEALIVAQQQSLEALSKAVRKVLAGLKAMSSRNSELLAATTQRVLREPHQLVDCTLPNERMVRKLNSARKELEYSLKEVDEVTQIACRAYRDAFFVLTDRFDAELSEAGRGPRQHLECR